MKKHFITLGALALMISFSTPELQANNNGSILPITQSVSQASSIEQTVLQILKDKTGTDITAGFMGCTFKEIGFDSLDFVDFNEVVERETNISTTCVKDYYNKTIRDYIQRLEQQQ